MEEGQRGRWDGGEWDRREEYRGGRDGERRIDGERGMEEGGMKEREMQEGVIGREGGRDEERRMVGGRTSYTVDSVVKAG